MDGGPRPGAALADWCRRLAEHLSDHRTVIGIGSPVTGPTHLRTALLEARRASSVLAQTSRHLTVARLTDLPTYHTLLSRADPQILHQLTTAILGLSGTTTPRTTANSKPPCAASWTTRPAP